MILIRTWLHLKLCNKQKLNITCTFFQVFIFPCISDEQMLFLPYLCVCVCVTERQREKKTNRQRQTETERSFQYHGLSSQVTLRKILNFYLISCWENFVERHSFRRVLGDSPETLRKLCLSTKFPHQEIKRIFGVLRGIR